MISSASLIETLLQLLLFQKTRSYKFIGKNLLKKYENEQQNTRLYYI